MSAITDALEQEVARVRAIRKTYRTTRDSRHKHAESRHFDRIMALIGPRVRHFTRAYGLTAWAEDAQQACAIAVHRAIDDYDDSRALFTTFVNWQLRGELKSLRNRLRPQFRDSYAAAQPRFVALNDEDPDGEVVELVDLSAVVRVEQGAATRLAHDALDRLFTDYERGVLEEARVRLSRAKRDADAKPGTLHPTAIPEMEAMLKKERTIVGRYVFADGKEDKFDEDPAMTAEQQRQVSRRVLRRLSGMAMHG